ncbi:MAG: phosphopyruvate hydratase [Candidatus Staskawiczbacteria bacterium RIFCSPHIGHO2_02_FULL_33_16]|uniref:Enolase n=1 Tax=Candidatus Staskawiczbacteria bacterium RIFCSPHIGHO2_02_FULL_33_16 TaxID=1802204 RepID=A0A1G2HSE8_9BACT|nr:MAG: phosphopyruvate hydratase [Candidatus Staskawiczbacteria bacterium RIFCSPHIGHO2_02_FULL_33_16]OGZ69936.1 MAG: phosphopyruvate hydratase [Candidatus Staskawiczbacteria bacterium RIFCSPLOWO2_01_FULL_33_13]
MSKIKEIIAREIKDSRGKPTVEVELETENGVFIASCPSGASTGKNEALELRDEDGRGVLRAIENVNKVIAPKLKGKEVANQKELDEIMIVLDGTENKSILGANAILPVSMAVCRAGAAALKLPLYAYISKISLNDLKMPLPSFNILNGGAHAKNELEFQEFMIVPQKKSFQENLVIGSVVFNKLTELLKERPEGVPQMGDEGGYAPQIGTVEQALFLIKGAIGEHQDVKIAMDCAASEFYRDGKYEVEDGKQLSRNEIVDFYKDLSERFPIISIEDPFSEEDWEGFKEIHKALPDTIIIGDDLTTTNIKKIKEAESKKACNGIIIKLNQIGTVSETIDAVNLAKSYGWKIMVSHRSGETMDSFIADLAVGTGADFIKSGAYTKDVRIVKYDRLLAIEQELSKNK